MNESAQGYLSPEEREEQAMLFKKIIGEGQNLMESKDPAQDKRAALRASYKKAHGELKVAGVEMPAFVTDEKHAQLMGTAPIEKPVHPLHELEDVVADSIIDATKARLRPKSATPPTIRPEHKIGTLQHRERSDDQLSA